MTTLPTIALSIRQPWAWLVVNGHKTTENRSKPTHYRGPVLIHASLTKASPEQIKQMHRDVAASCYRAAQLIPREVEGYYQGGIIGVAEIVDCKLISDDPWHLPGYFGWKLANARPLDFMPYRGALGFFKCEYANDKVKQPT